MRTVIWTALAGLPVALLAGCIPPGDPARSSGIAQSEASAPGRSAVALLRDTTGAEKGRATLTDAEPGKIRVTLDASGMPPGPRAFHIHTTGKCDAPDFMTAGGHWNPAMRQHGRDNPMGAHAGDMPNLVVGTDGRATVTAEVDGDLAGLLDADGAAVIVHAAPDDYKTDPTGNAGARIACGVVTATG